MNQAIEKEPPAFWRRMTVGSIGGLCLLVAAHPSFVIMSGSVNNDMLSVLFIGLCIYAGLCWLEAHTFRNLLAVALCIGLGMITKLTVAAMAFPVGFIFLLYLIQVVKGGDKKAIRICLLRFAVFGLVCGVIGLSWVVRNLAIYGENPGVPVPGVTSPMYTLPFDWWQRIHRRGVSGGTAGLCAGFCSDCLCPLPGDGCAGAGAVCAHAG